MWSAIKNVAIAVRIVCTAIKETSEIVRKYNAKKRLTANYNSAVDKLFDNTDTNGGA
jgi:hypothetical protein